MFKSLRTLAFATLLPFALPTLAQVNATLPANVQKALQTNKLTGNDLSLVLIPLDGPGNPTYYNADVSVNPASTMKLFTTYAALEMLGPTYQWKTEFYTDGQLKNGVLNGNLYLKGGGDPKLNMEKLWLLMRDLRANGVTKVTGDLVLDRSYFNIPQLPVFNDDGGDDAQAAQRVVRQWLARKGITAPRLVMENGSGLSRQERVSAREMAAMLQAAWHSPYAAEYISSLPLAGLDGTMRKRLRRTALVGEAHVKTGTLNTVRALAGFSRDASGHNWVVVAILNSPRPWGASAILDQVLLSLHTRK
ncbi:TPA: D-alanyl-D-alanine carboxypeptidase/D-alanyl-D-alanine-endopeptidase [Pseudomonas aeruginosa]